MVGLERNAWSEAECMEWKPHILVHVEVESLRNSNPKGLVCEANFDFGKLGTLFKFKS